MKLESNKYKNRILAIIILLVISTILGTVAEKQVKKNADYVDSLVATIQSIPAEEYEERVKQKEFGEDISAYETKEKALEITQNWQKMYHPIFKSSELYAVIVFSLAMSGTFIGIMMYYIFTGWILYKIWPDIKLWMSVLMRILVLIILLFPLFYVLVTIGLFGQLPFVIYTLYKYIKSKRAEDKDDVIVEK